MYFLINVVIIVKLKINLIDMKEKIVNYLLSKKWFMSIVRQHFLDAINSIKINTAAFGCGLEDAGITDKYEAMEFGIGHTIEEAVEVIENVV